MKPQFGVDITNQPSNMTAMMHCTRMAGRAVIRVVGRCDDAKENKNLDLSECQLMQVPDAVFHLMRHTQLQGCNLSSNVITKIPPKLALKFSNITELNLSHNRLSKLPEEVGELSKLRRINISHNSFVTLPRALFKLPRLNCLNALKNYVAEVEVELVRTCTSLQEMDLRENPITTPTRKSLLGLPVRLTVRLSQAPPEEDWDHLEEIED